MIFAAARTTSIGAVLLSIVTLLLTVRADAESRDLYDRSVHGLLHASGLPVLLPATIPTPIGAVVSVAVIDADREGYYVGYSTHAGCNGGLSCAILHVAAYRRSSVAGRTYGRDRRVSLPDHSHGYYSARDCSGSSCVESSLTFARRNAIYEIDAKVTPALPLLFEVYRRLRPLEPQSHRSYGR